MSPLPLEQSANGGHAACWAVLVAIADSTQKIQVKQVVGHSLPVRGLLVCQNGDGPIVIGPIQEHTFDFAAEELKLGGDLMYIHVHEQTADRL